jgi:hypothetical protein
MFQQKPERSDHEQLVCQAESEGELDSEAIIKFRTQCQFILVIST